jgi:predicted nucleic-acid-binding Zn-ribbon protein
MFVEVNMKNSMKCPKCQSCNIVRIEGQVGAYGSGNNIMTGITIFSAVKVTRYLCADCGFSEEWIESKDDLDKLRNKFMQS